MLEYQVYYVFYVLNPTHYYQGREEIKRASQKIHSLLPNNPFYDYSNRLLVNILVVYTTL